MNEAEITSNVQGWSNAGPGRLPRCCSCQLRSVSDMDAPLIVFATLTGRGGRLSHFSKPQHHDVVFLSVIVGGAAIAGFFFPFTAIEVGDGPAFITSTTTLSVSTKTLWTSETDPFCCGRGLTKSNAARMLERMTTVAKKVRSTLGFARWLIIVKGPGSENNDDSESASERPWTLSMAGSWRSIMIRRRGMKSKSCH